MDILVINNNGGNAYSTQRLAYLLQKEFEGAIKSYPYSDIDMDNIEWYSIAFEYMEGTEQ